MQIVITNQQGVTLRIAPNTGGGIVRQVVQGEVLTLDNLIFSQPQTFNTLNMDEVREAFVNKIVRGDVWGRLAEQVGYRGEPAFAYIALKVGVVYFGFFLPEPVTPPAGSDYSKGFADGQKLVYNKFAAFVEVEKARVV